MILGSKKNHTYILGRRQVLPGVTFTRVRPHFPLTKGSCAVVELLDYEFTCQFNFDDGLIGYARRRTPRCRYRATQAPRGNPGRPDSKVLRHLHYQGPSINTCSLSVTTQDNASPSVVRIVVHHRGLLARRRACKALCR